MTVGIGFDIHRLVPGRRLVLGGVAIDHPFGLMGHSDGDAVLHAVIDAMLGAAGAGDIGRRFPDTDEAWRDIASEVLLSRVADELRDKWEPVNVDVTILAEEPKIAPHREEIRTKIAEILRLESGRVNVKAKTMEGLGPIGAREAIAAFAAVEMKER